MVVVKYTGKGLISQNIHFNPNYNDGLYEVPKNTSEYLLKTFPNDFVLIEKKVEEKVDEKKTSPKKPSRRKKKVEEVQSEDSK
jgi:hypothetical protein